MLKERVQAIEEDLMECENLPELKAIWCNWQSDAPEAANDAESVLKLKSTLQRIRMFGNAAEQPQDFAMPTERQPRPPVQRARTDKRYVLLKTDVSWSTKPQVHALMRILEAHLSPGDVCNESDIVRMVEENASILDTKQGGKRIWDYYKGDHNEGLMAHGNVGRL